MSQRKWLALFGALAILLVLVIASFIVQLRNTNERIEAIHGPRLDSYQAIEEIMYYNIERANAIRGLLAYDDRRFLEAYYSMSQRAKELKASIAGDPETPSSLLDLLYRDGIWEQEADRVLVIYETGDLAEATAVAETMTDQRQTILEDLRSLKKMQYNDIRKQLTATQREIDIATQALISVAILLIAILVILIFLMAKTKKRIDRD
ncbi:MAG: hypothetical protein LPJ96_05445 [Exiguobacterium sp.]|uniref:Chemotaxis methyl-accepting receptor HlyB-like 4HB MCP domain-containing protein n=1 Tax=Exiguobacterium alkaliphilum TaxID=1428684 RepID=A0ABT2KTG1_9BACL|nr:MULTISPECIES: hypothetical protein [Exiguobacterium]MDX5323032.1 hypothetical protein [Exiguobacterium sp.]KDN58073.1 hypothetical protein DI14_14085 [Exiguobacterium sp. AB2]MCT4794262.1 hypothetical protein [Exiguobacterium alkaliphilum]MDX5424802.1 hypothetical protein [Exiguobacterium sp.]MDX6772264.1 hypothetical protein [Exiguobacterium sp.]